MHSLHSIAVRSPPSVMHDEKKAVLTSFWDTSSSILTSLQHKVISIETEGLGHWGHYVAYLACAPNGSTPAKIAAEWLGKATAVIFWLVVEPFGADGSKMEVKILVPSPDKKYNSSSSERPDILMYRYCGRFRKARTPRTAVLNASIAMTERPYVESDLNDLKKRSEFAALIKRQMEKFPKPKGQLGKVSIAEMKGMLLDRQMGFTTPGIGEEQHHLPDQIISTAPVHNEPVQQQLLSEQTLAATPVHDEPVQQFSSDSEHPLKSIQLLVEDQRSTSSIMNVSQRVDVKLVDVHGCQDGEWHASSVDIFRALQSSMGRLQGSGRIGIPDRQSSNYTEYFITFNDDEATFAPHLTNLVVPKENRLSLRVHHLFLLKREHSPSPAPADTVQSLIPSSSGATTTEVSNKPASILWLQEKIQRRPGYVKFRSNRGKVLQNVDRVEFWRFAAEVSEMYCKTCWPSHISNKKITRSAVETALEIGSTSLTDALNMTRILKLYTTEGPNKSDEVVTEICKSQENIIPGATALKLFLQKWENEHPIIDN
ncbi:hypothetical protein B0H11DRAFT_2192366 [Mycena galericulata]|nr:hypothetical protein B0H11DRAFT_2192366 [Mycena galericulata]